MNEDFSMTILTTAGSFLVSTAAGLILFALAARLFMQVARVGVFHPLMDAVIKLTDPIVRVTKPFVPHGDRIEIPLISLIILVELVKLTCLYVLNVGGIPSLLALLCMAVAEGMHLLANLCFFAVLGEAALSWIPSLRGGPIAGMLQVVTAPILVPIRKALAKTGMSTSIDLSPLAALVVLQMIEIVVIDPLVGAAFGLMQ
jgi:YggT family protein